MMTDERLNEIQEALEAANTNRKWEVDWAGASRGFNIKTETTIIAGYLSRPDAEFLCNAPIYVRELLEEVEWLQSEREKDALALRAAACRAANFLTLEIDPTKKEGQDDR